MEQTQTIILSNQSRLDDGSEIKISLNIEKLTPFNYIEILNRVTSLTNDVVYKQLPELMTNKPT